MSGVGPSMLEDAAVPTSDAGAEAIQESLGMGATTGGHRAFQGVAAARAIPSFAVIADLLRAVDCCIVVATSWFALLLYSPIEQNDWSEYGLVAILGGLLLVNVMQLQGAYHRDQIRMPTGRLSRTASAVFLSAGVLIAVAFVTKASAEYSRGWAVLWLALTLGAIVGVRVALAMMWLFLRRFTSDILQRKVAVVGTSPDAERLVEHLMTVDRDGIRIVGVYGFGSYRRQTTAGATVADLCGLCRTAELDTIYIVMPLSGEAPAVEAMNKLRCLPVDLRLLMAPLGYHLLNRRVSYLDQLPVIHVADRPLGGWGRMVKRIEDFTLAAIGLVSLGAVMLLIAGAIKLDSPGPVFFRQKRYGFNSQLIEVLKFRTMYHDQCDPNGSVLTSRRDARVTPLGRFLRRTSLDELPQLINILRGEMSAVGPRPHAIEAKAANRLYQDIVGDYAARHKVKPGMTGWAQVNGWRGTTETEEQIKKRIEHDLWYLDNWTVLFDLKIIAMTIAVMILDKHAY